MSLPFTSAQFFDVFGAYNRALWVVALGLWLYAVAGAVVLARFSRRSRFVSILLAVQWAWAGLAYHAVFFSRVNPAACSGVGDGSAVDLWIVDRELIRNVVGVGVA